MSMICRVTHCPRTWKLSIAGTATVGVIPLDVVAAGAADLLHVPLRVLEAGEGMALEDDVGEDPVDPRLHLVGEAGHHGVDDDHRRHAKSHTDDARQGDPAGAEVAPAEEEGVQGDQSSVCGRWMGKRITSRIEADCVRSITSLSMPIPRPPAGGMP